MNWAQKIAVIGVALVVLQVLVSCGAELLGRLILWWPVRRPVAPAVLLGWQEDGQGDEIALYNLTEDIEGHPAGSTVSARTLEAAGYRLPWELRRLFGLGGES